MRYLGLLIHKLFDKGHMFYTRSMFKMRYKDRLCIGNGTLWRKALNINIANNAKIVVGENCFFNNYCSLNSLGIIKIGRNSIFGENVKIYDHNHKFNSQNIPVSKQGFSVGEVTIGENCWVGSNVTILKNSHIGDNCVIAAGCIVAQDIPSGSILKRGNCGNVLEEINYK